MLQGSRRQIGGLQILMRGNNMKLLKGKQSENKAQYLHLCAIECKCNQLLSGYFFFFMSMMSCSTVIIFSIYRFPAL